MKLQDYKCNECGSTWTSEWVDSDDKVFGLIPCPFCYQLGIKKVFSVSFNPGMKEHFNMATGAVETSMKSIKEKFKKASDEATERTGIPHNFQPIDLNDRAATGQTDEGLEATHRRAREEGRTEGKTYVQMNIPKGPSFGVG